MATSKKETTQVVDMFTKEQLVKSKRYMRFADFLNGNLQNDKKYTIEQVDKLISKHYGKGKSE